MTTKVAVGGDAVLEDELGQDPRRHQRATTRWTRPTANSLAEARPVRRAQSAKGDRSTGDWTHGKREQGPR